MNLTTLQQIENKLLEGFETMYLYIEEDWSYDTVTVNIKELLQKIAIGEEYVVGDYDYTIYSVGRNTDREGNLLGLAKDDLMSGSGCYNVFADEQEVIDFCVKMYIEDKMEDDDTSVSIAEATKFVVNESNGSFKIK
tara:strand:- start:57 stop:467 length:411 start_codon:yes stop_codon:yes gene_type:complete